MRNFLSSNDIHSDDLFSSTFRKEKYKIFLRKILLYFISEVWVVEDCMRKKVLIKFLFPFHSVSCENVFLRSFVHSQIFLPFIPLLLFICLPTWVSAYFSSGIDLTCSSTRKITRIRSWLNNFSLSFFRYNNWKSLDISRKIDPTQ